MDNMFRQSSGHHQVQYKEMWSSTELRTRMGSHKRSQIPLAPPADFVPIFLSSGTSTLLFVNANGIPFIWVTLYYSKSPCIGPDDGHLMAEKCCPFWRLYGNKYTLLCCDVPFCILYLILCRTPGCLLWVLSSLLC